MSFYFIVSSFSFHWLPLVYMASIVFSPLLFCFNFLLLFLVLTYLMFFCGLSIILCFSLISYFSTTLTLVSRLIYLAFVLAFYRLLYSLLFCPFLLIPSVSLSTLSLGFPYFFSRVSCPLLFFTHVALFFPCLSCLSTFLPRFYFRAYSCFILPVVPPFPSSSESFLFCPIVFVPCLHFLFASLAMLSFLASLSLFL